MRIYTKVVWQWQGDELVEIESESYEYEGPVDYAKGGGGGPDNYANLDRLYGIQADQAEFLGQTFKGTVAPAYKRWMGEAEDYGSTANQEQAAQRAGKAASGATSEQQRAQEANMASMGINPADARYQQQFKEAGVQGAGQQAAAETAAREGVRNTGFARMQDVIGMGMGTPTQASQAAAAAAKTADINLSSQNQRAAAQQGSVADIARAGMNLYGAYSDKGGGSGVSYAADGGYMSKGRQEILRLNQGGYVQRLAKGGFAGGMTPGGGGAGKGGFMSMPEVAPPPASATGPKPMSTAAAATGVAATPAGMAAAKQGAGMAIEAGGNAAGSPYAASLGRGLQLNPAQARAAADAYNAGAKQMAQTAVDKEMGVQGYSQAAEAATPAETDAALANAQVGASQTAAANTSALEATQLGATSLGEAETGLASYTAAETAATAAPVAAEVAAPIAAEGLAASGAGLGLAAGIGTAVPAIGAGLALYGIGNAAGWWADGGEVTPGSHGAAGGEVDGPGGPKDDEILAALSDGEFVMPVGAVKYFGIDRLEKMRQKGLEHEKSMGISR